MAPTCMGVTPAEPNRLAFAIVGVPNAGKTTTKNMLTESYVATSNVPFHTTEASLSSGCILDQRCSALAAKLVGSHAVPTKFSLIDTPGIVTGLSEDAGIAVDLYPMLRQADAFFQVCRVFEADDVVHTDGEVDPIRDSEALQNELIALDIRYVKEQLDKKAKHRDEYVQHVFEKVVKCLQAGTPVRHAVWTSREEDVIASHKLTTCKPMVYLLNLVDADFVRQKNKWLAKIFRWVKEKDAGAPIVPFCATFEEQLQSLENDDARADYMNEVGASKSMREKVIDAGYEATNVIRFYTTLNGAAMVWSVPRGIRAPQAAGVVRSDLEAAFAGVEVSGWDEYNSENNEAALKQAGKLHQKGKDYVITDGDVIHFKSNASPKHRPNLNPGSPMNKPHSNPSTPTNKRTKALGSPNNKASGSSPTITPSSDSASAPLLPLDGFRLEDD